MASAVAAGAALTVPWYFETGTAFAFYQSQGLRMFAQPLRGVGQGVFRSLLLMPSLHQLPGLHTFHLTLHNSQISYILTLVLLRCGAITRLCRWVEEHNPRSISAAF